MAYHGEGPVWSERWGGLRWVDMLAGDVLSLAADGAVEPAPRRDGRRRRSARAAGAARSSAWSGASRWRTPTGRSRTSTSCGATIGVRMNEGGCDPDGRFYCGSMAYDQRARAPASLYRLDPDGSVHVVLEGVTVSNGLDWSPDGSRAYYNDTATHRVDVFDYDREAGLDRAAPVRETPAEPTGPTA